MARRHLTQEQVIQQFRKVHNGRYTYFNFIYVDNFTKGLVTCPIHGDFLQLPSHHKSGNGCPKCAGKHLTQEQVIQQFKQKHGDLYTYYNFNYVDNNTKGLITCSIHGDFLQTPGSHKSGNGCPDCFNFRTKYHNKPTIVYFLHIKDNLYKIGITTRPIQERIRELSKILPIKVIRTKQFPTGKQAYQYEQKILNKFKAYRYQGKDIISTGNSELIKIKRI